MEKRCLVGKRVAFIHDVEIEVDTRSQKEIATLKNAGAEVVVCAWNKNISKKNMQYNLLVRGLNMRVENICVKVEKTKGLRANILPLIKYQFKLYAWLRRNRTKFDYIHSVDLDVSFLASIFAKLHRKRFIYDVYDDYADCHAPKGSKLHRIIRWIDKGIINKSDTVIICSEKRIDQLAKKPKNLVVIHNSPDICENDNSNEFVMNNNKLNIAYAGNLFPGRMTLEMAKLIADSNNMELYCGGAGQYEDELRVLSKKYTNIHFYGRMKYEDVIAMEMKCDVIPALYDPSFANHTYAAPNKFYEALFLGKPTIMAKNTGMDDMVEKLESGLVIDFDIESLKKALETIEKNKEYWKSRSEELKMKFKTLYSWEEMEKRLLHIYSDEV